MTPQCSVPPLLTARTGGFSYLFKVPISTPRFQPVGSEVYCRVPYEVFFDGITTLFLTYKITEILSKLRKFLTSLSSEIHADLMLYLDTGQFSKVFGLFQISFHYFCVEIFSSQGTEMSELLHAMVDHGRTASPENSTII
jgi:hypothetical protein